MELALRIRQPRRWVELFGAGDKHLRRIREKFGVRAHARDDVLRLLGPSANVSKAAAVIEQMQDALQQRDFLDDDAVEDVIADVEQEEGGEIANGQIRVFSRDSVAGRTEGQRDYVHAMLNHDLVFCVGPAGTGKTYLAVAVAVSMLKRGQVKRIALVRPAVEAGEKLGFLPGDLQQKVNPYLRPLFDAMHDMMTFDQLKRFMVSDIVEVVPLAYMRGRTLNHAAIILDEAQNTTPSQMFMFLTRLGNDSKMIVTGDDSQIDLEPNQQSGLTDAVRRLRDCEGVAIRRLSKADIVRHQLVQNIVNRYAERGCGAAGRPDDPPRP